MNVLVEREYLEAIANAIRARCGDDKEYTPKEMAPAILRIPGGEVPKTLTAIAVTTPPYQTEYTNGDTFNAAGMVVTAYYTAFGLEYGTEVISDYSLSPTVLNDGDTEVTITYSEGDITVTAAVSVKVNPSIVEYTFIPPTKTQYVYGDTVDTTDMSLKALLSNGTVEDLTNEVSIKPATLTTVTNSQTIVVTYKEKSWSFEVSVNKAPVAKPTLSTPLVPYTGSTVHPNIIGYDPNKMIRSGTYQAVNAGLYTVSFTPKNDYYEWIDGTIDPVTIEWEITSAAILKPTLMDITYIYNGTRQSVQVNNYNSTGMTRGGTYSATDAGTYTVTFTPRANYIWDDGTKDAVSLVWTITKAPSIVTVDTTTLSIDNETPTAVLTLGGKGTGTLDTVYDTSVMTVTVDGTTLTITRVEGSADGNYTLVIKRLEDTNYLASDPVTIDITYTTSYAYDWGGDYATTEDNPDDYSWYQELKEALPLMSTKQRQSLLGKTKEHYEGALWANTGRNQSGATANGIPARLMVVHDNGDGSVIMAFVATTDDYRLKDKAWATSSFKTLLDNLYNKLPDGIKTYIQPVTFENTEFTLFVPSGQQLGGGSNAINIGEDAFPFFNSSAKRSLIKQCWYGSNGYYDQTQALRGNNGSEANDLYNGNVSKMQLGFSTPNTPFPIFFKFG